MSVQDDFRRELLEAAAERTERVEQATIEAQAASEENASIEAEKRRLQPLICGVMRRDAQIFAQTMSELGKAPTYRLEMGEERAPRGLGRFTLSGIRAEFRDSSGYWEKFPNAWIIRAFAELGPVRSKYMGMKYEGPPCTERDEYPTAMFVDVNGGIFLDRDIMLSPITQRIRRAVTSKSDWIERDIAYHSRTVNGTRMFPRHNVPDEFMTPIFDIQLGIEVPTQPLVLQWRQQLKSVVLAD